VTHERSRPIVIIEGDVFTADPDQARAEAVALDGGIIAGVGSTLDLLAEFPAAEVIDVQGRTVLPGLIDAHNHFLATGESLASIDVRYPRVATLDDLINVIAEAVVTNSGDRFIRAHGFDHSKYERTPTRWDLDAVTGDAPVVIEHISGHYALANSLAMERGGVTEMTPDPPGGLLDRDVAGTPTGLFQDAAMGMVLPTQVDIGHHGPNFHHDADIDELVSAVERAGLAFLAAGITTVCDPQVTRREMTGYQEARRQGKLLIRTVCMPLSHQLDDFAAIGLAGPFGDEWLSIGPMKFYCDGSLIGGTACFSTPYGEDGELEGVLFWDEVEFADAIERAHAAGWQVGVHAQGDKAICLTLDAFERAQRSHPVSDPRFRIEHWGYPTPEILDRMAALDVIAVVQPSYLHDSGDDFLDRLADRAHGLQPLRTAIDHGIRVVLSSDSDVASYKPLDTIAAALLRRSHEGAVLGPLETITIEEAVLAHTIEAARSIRAEERIGSLHVGKLADLVVLDGNLFDCDADEIDRIQVLLTIVGGQIVFDHRPRQA
jgi:predicted amidohydrolase YtcJ